MEREVEEEEEDARLDGLRFLKETLRCEPPPRCEALIPGSRNTALRWELLRGEALALLASPLLSSLLLELSPEGY